MGSYGKINEEYEIKNMTKKGITNDKFDHLIYKPSSLTTSNVKSVEGF